MSVNYYKSVSYHRTHAPIEVQIGIWTSMVTYVQLRLLVYLKYFQRLLVILMMDQSRTDRKHEEEGEQS